MAQEPFTFMELYRAGVVTKDDIDDYVELWHHSSTGVSLAKFLGMSNEAYKRWVEINEL